MVGTSLFVLTPPPPMSRIVTIFNVPPSPSPGTSFLNDRLEQSESKQLHKLHSSKTDSFNQNKNIDIRSLNINWSIGLTSLDIVT